MAESPPGYCWSGTGNTLVTSIMLQDVNFTNALKGSTFSTKQSNGTSIDMQCMYTVVGRPVGITLSNKVTMLLPPSNITQGYYKLSNDIDIQLVFSFKNNEKVAAPFTDKTYVVYNHSITNFIQQTQNDINKDITVNLKLRRNIIGGASVIPLGIPIAAAYSKVEYLPVHQLRPMFGKYDKIITTFTSGYLTVITPQQCRINNNEIINIDFYDINSTTLSTDGSTLAKKVPITVLCNGAVGSNTVVILNANASTFSTNMIKTNKSNIGIVIKENNKIVKPGGYFPIIMNGQNGSALLEVAPVKNPNQKPEVGDFSASATLIFSLE